MSFSPRIVRKLQELFPDTDAQNCAAAALDSFLEKSRGRESERLLLAILKLSEGDQSKLLHAIESALVDYRDVLAWAEYPEVMTLGGDEEAELLDAARARDLDQYQRWLGDEATQSESGSVGRKRSTE